MSNDEIPDRFAIWENKQIVCFVWMTPNEVRAIGERNPHLSFTPAGMP